MPVCTMHALIWDRAACPARIQVRTLISSMRMPEVCMYMQKIESRVNTDRDVQVSLVIVILPSYIGLQTIEQSGHGHGESAG